MEAGVRLRASLWDAISEYPNARHVIIAHSHGGNVALYALKDHELRSRIAGVVALATPFLSTQLRRIDWIVRMAGVTLGFHTGYWFLFLAVMVLAYGMALIGLPRNSPDSILDLIASACGRVFVAYYLIRLGAALSTRFGRWVIWKGRAWVRRQQRRALRCYPRLVYPGLNLLNIQAPRDEARLLLRFFASVADIPLKLLFHPISVAASLIWSAVALTLWVAAISRQIESVPWWVWVMTVVYIANFSCFLVLIQLVLFAPVVTILQTFTRGHVAGFGLERFAINAVVRVRSEPEPRIRGAKVVNPDCDYSDWRKSAGRFDLRHSWAYKAPAPAAEIERFLGSLSPSTPVRQEGPVFEEAPALRRVKKAFRATWMERGLFALVLAVCTFIIIAPAGIEADEFLPGMKRGDHALVLNIPFFTRGLIEKDRAVVAVDFSPLSKAWQDDERKSLWEYANSTRTHLPYLYMRVARLPGESRATPHWKPTASTSAFLDYEASHQELSRICREESDKVSAAGSPIPMDSVEVESLDPAVYPCAAIVPQWWIGGRVVAVFPGWKIWRVQATPLAPLYYPPPPPPPPDLPTPAPAEERPAGRVPLQAEPDPPMLRPPPPVDAKPDDAYLSFGETFEVADLPNVDIANPHDMARYSVYLCKEGLTREIPKRLRRLDSDVSLSAAFSTYTREFGPDLEKFKGVALRLEFAGYFPPPPSWNGSSIWYYYLKDAGGGYVEHKSWVSLRRSSAGKISALTGIFLNSEGAPSDIPSTARRK
jgi:hypothetical protein